MRDLFTVINFTVKEAVKRKSFIISMIIILLIIVVGFNIPNIIGNFKGEGEAKEKVLIIDEQNIFENELISINNEEKYEYTMLKDNISQDEIKEKLENDEYDSCIRSKKEDGKIKIDYIVKSLMMGESAPQSIIEDFQTQYTAVQIKKSGVTPEQLQTMFTEFDVNAIQTDENAGSGNIFVMMMLSIVYFLQFTIVHIKYQHQ